MMVSQQRTGWLTLSRLLVTTVLFGGFFMPGVHNMNEASNHYPLMGQVAVADWDELLLRCQAELVGIGEEIQDGSNGADNDDGDGDQVAQSKPGQEAIVISQEALQMARSCDYLPDSQLASEEYWICRCLRRHLIVPAEQEDVSMVKRGLGSIVLSGKRMNGKLLTGPSGTASHVNRRMMGSEFLGKRAMGSEFLGKRQMGSEFLGKRAMGSEFLGKRAMGSEFLGKRAMGSEFLGKRAMGSEFLGKRAMGSEFLGKRAMGSEFLGKRAMGSEFLGKRAMGSEFLGKRATGIEEVPSDFSPRLDM